MKMVEACLKWVVFGSFRNSKEGPSAFDALIHACDREGSCHVATQLMAEWGQQVTALLGSTGDRPGLFGCGTTGSPP